MIRVALVGLLTASLLSAPSVADVPKAPAPPQAVGSVPFTQQEMIVNSNALNMAAAACGTATFPECESLRAQAPAMQAKLKAAYDAMTPAKK